jgi:hypothetical protein
MAYHHEFPHYSKGRGTEVQPGRHPDLRRWSSESWRTKTGEFIGYNTREMIIAQTEGIPASRKSTSTV